MKTTPTIAAALCALTLAGCAGDPYSHGYGNKQTGGAVLGGIVGGLAGSQIGGGTGKLVAVGVGTLLGAAIGASAGASLDRADVAYAERAQYQAYNAPQGSTIRWNNPQTGNWGTYTPQRDGYTDRGEYCREYRTTINVAGRSQQGYGTACRQPDGTWRIVQ